MGTRNEGRSSPFGGQRLIPVVNGSESAIPAGGIVWLDGASTVGGQAVMSAKQANSDDHPWFVALAAIAVGGRGVVTREWPAWAAYDTAEAAPSVDDEIGPVSGNWRMRPEGTGFIAITDGADGWVMVVGIDAVEPTEIKMVKLETGESLSYLAPGSPASAREYIGTPGSETVDGDPFDIYGGHQLQSPIIINASDGYFLIVGRVNDQWQLLGPWRDAGSGGSGGIVILQLPSDLTQAQQTKASCTVLETYTGGPSVSSTVTARNPVNRAGSGYLWKATAATQVVVAHYNGTDYTISNVEHVTQTVVIDMEDDGTDLIEHKKDIQTPFADNPQDETLISGTTCAE